MRWVSLLRAKTHLHIAKNRSGQTDTIKVRFIKEYQKFVDIEDNFGGGFGGTNPKGDNPAAGIRGRDVSEFGGSKLYVPGGFQTMQSKASDYTDDEEDMGGSAKLPKQRPMDEEPPF